MEKSTQSIDGLRLKLARLTAGLTEEVAAKRLHTNSMSIAQWEKGTVHPTLSSAKKVNEWIRDVDAKYGPLRLPDRGGEDIVLLRKKFTRKYIAQRLKIGFRTVDALQNRKAFDLKPGVFELVKRIKELELVKEMPDVFTKDEMKRLNWLLTNKPGMIMKLSKTGPFSFWTVLRWMNGTHWPLRGFYTKRLRTWMKKLEALNRQL